MPNLEFKRVIERTFEVFKKLGLEGEKIPLGARRRYRQVPKIDTALKGWGASAVQIGTAFAVTHEGDAHINFKKTLAGADTEQVVEFMSVAGLPRPRRKNEISRKLYEARKRAASQRQSRPTPLHPRHQLPLRVRPARRLGKSRQILHRPQTRRSLARRSAQRPLLPAGKDPLPFGKTLATACKKPFIIWSAAKCLW